MAHTVLVKDLNPISRFFVTVLPIFFIGTFLSSHFWDVSLKNDRADRAVPPLYLVRAGNGYIVADNDGIFIVKEARCFSATTFGLSACDRQCSWRGRSRRRLHRRTIIFRRNPALFRPRAARTDDGVLRPVEPPRSFRHRRAEPVARRACL